MEIVVFWLLLLMITLALVFLIMIPLFVLEMDLVLQITPAHVKMGTAVHNANSLVVVGLFKQILRYVLEMERVSDLINAFVNLVIQESRVCSSHALDCPQLTQPFASSR